MTAEHTQPVRGGAIAPRVRYERLDNGLDVYLLPASTPDIVYTDLSLPGGVRRTYETPTVAFVTGELLPGSTEKRTRSDVLDTLDRMGASLSFSESGERHRLTLQSLRKNLAKALDVAFESILDPRVTAPEFREALLRTSESLKHELEDTDSRVEEELTQALYKKGHPHWMPRIKDLMRELKTLRRVDSTRFLNETVSAEGAVLTIVGDIDEDEVLRVVRRLAKRLPCVHPREPVAHVDRTQTTLVSDIIVPMHDKMNVDTVLRIPLSITRDHTDFIPLTVAASILGGSTTARLFHTLRTTMSLTYGAYASIGGHTDGYPGYLSASAIFPNDVFLRGREALRTVVREFVAHGVTEDELSRKKAEVAGRHKVSLSTVRTLSQILTSTVLSKHDPSFIDEYPKIVEHLTLRDINDAITRHLDYTLAVCAAAGAIDREGAPLA